MPVQPVLGSHSEEILHFAGVRLRVTGSGNLRMTFFSLDDVDSSTLAPIAMQTSTGREPTRLANFISQRGMLQIQTTAINETMRINRIILFAKPIWSQYPG
jgi:hypothetical protein